MREPGIQLLFERNDRFLYYPANSNVFFTGWVYTSSIRSMMIVILIFNMLLFVWDRNILIILVPSSKNSFLYGTTIFSGGKRFYMGATDPQGHPLPTSVNLHTVRFDLEILESSDGSGRQMWKYWKRTLNFMSCWAKVYLFI